MDAVPAFAESAGFVFFALIAMGAAIAVVCRVLVERAAAEPARPRYDPTAIPTACRTCGHVDRCRTASGRPAKEPHRTRALVGTR